MEVIYKPVGVVHTPFKSLEEMPIQPTSDASGPGVVEVFPEFTDALKDLEGFSHIYLLYHFHKVRQSQLMVTPFLDSQLHGIFATRAPSRPNPLGLSLVKLVRIESNLVNVEGVDVLDETPLLDIKPYVPEFENTRDIRIGWLEHVKGNIRTQRSDDRFK
jgi:tRNA-Thr(GGU) m(6)t(6)A37 methyltransferase TsaA